MALRVIRTIQPAFYVIQCFDHEGYHTCLRGETLEEVREKAARKKSPNLIAMTLPFYGKWETWNGKHIQDVSTPDDWKEALVTLDSGERDD